MRHKLVDAEEIGCVTAESARAVIDELTEALRCLRFPIVKRDDRMWWIEDQAIPQSMGFPTEAAAREEVQRLDPLEQFVRLEDRNG